MKLFKIKAETGWRLLNIWNTSYTFDAEWFCLIPEHDATWLPLTYKKVWEVEDTKETIPEVEIKKVVPVEVPLAKVVKPAVVEVAKKVETPKVETPKVETPKVETPKVIKK